MDIFKRISSFIVLIILTLKLVSATTFDYEASFTPDHIRYLKNETRQLFAHAWSSYMEHGFPADEVRPDTCEPHGPDFKNKYDIIRNDALGNYSSTLIDNIDTLIIMEEWDELAFVLDYLKRERDNIFNSDTVVQVFETTIRALGGLLSLHLLLTDLPTERMKNTESADSFSRIAQSYDGFLLDMAHSLGVKLISAFRTKTSIPVPRINLKTGPPGVPVKLQRENCVAGATSPVLEFTLLTKLTGDPQFERYSKLTFWKLWGSRLDLDLVPTSIDPIGSQWLDDITGIGASVDSFYEYALKSSILFDDEEMLSVFKESYQSLLTHLTVPTGCSNCEMLFGVIDVNQGMARSYWIDLLGAFFPGLQVLAGQVEDARRTHLIYMKLWDYYEAIPERWSYYVHSTSDAPLSRDAAIFLEWYPLRPEFIESTYYLYRATRDPMYLQIGATILKQLQTKFKAKCGFHGIQDVRTGQTQNRMESFVLSETLKYLYLLFDADNEVFLHTEVMRGKNWVFSTEAHPLWLHKGIIRNLTSAELGSSKKKRLVGAKLKSFIPHLGHKKKKSNERSTQRPELVKEQIEMPGLDSKYLKQVDYFTEKLRTCEVSSKSLLPHFISSFYYHWDGTFSPDYLHQQLLMRPEYLSQNLLDGAYIELAGAFFDKFSLFSPTAGARYKQCPVPTTTSSFDVLLGDQLMVRNSHVSIIMRSQSLPPGPPHLPLPEDLWLPHLDALRIKFEVLLPDLIDSHFNRISPDFVASIHASSGTSTNSSTYSTTSANSSQLLRISKVNGVPVLPKIKIWTSPFETVLQPDNLSMFDISDSGRVIIDNLLVMNLFVWNHDSCFRQ